LNRLFPPRFPLAPLPQDLLLGLPLGAHIEEVTPCLCPVPTPPALSGGPILRPVYALPSEAVTCLQPVEPQGEPPGTTCYRNVGLLPARHTVSFPGGPAPAHCRASAHSFSEISRLRCARDLGSGIVRALTQSEYPSHSTPWASGFSAASLAHSSAFSLPGTPLCAGTTRSSSHVRDSRESRIAWLPVICEEVTDLNPILPPSSHLQHFRP